MRYTNDHGISLPLQVWLATDNYDAQTAPEGKKIISATSLLKPVRQIVLSARVDATALSVDLMDMVASRSGTAFHDAIEFAWKNNYKQALKDLGYKDKQIDRIRINPTPEELKADPKIIPVYMEQRTEREIGNWIISGKYDFVFDNTVTDFKSTSTYKWQKNASDDDYKMQGSIYKWLNPVIITNNVINIEFIFTDFSKLRALKEGNQGYPPQRLMQKNVDLMSVNETERWITRKLDLVDRYMDVVDEQIPECTQEELWQDPTSYKYYKDPAKTTRATRDFKQDKLAAYQRKNDDGGTGLVKEIKGKAKACNYCNARPICKQYQQLLAEKLIIPL